MKADMIVSLVEQSEVILEAPCSRPRPSVHSEPTLRVDNRLQVCEVETASACHRHLSADLSVARPRAQGRSGPG